MGRMTQMRALAFRRGTGHQSTMAGGGTSRITPAAADSTANTSVPCSALGGSPS